MVGHLRLNRCEEIAQFIAHRLDLLQFPKIGSAAGKKLAVLLQKFRHVVLEIIDVEIPRFLARLAWALRLLQGGIFLLNQRGAAGAWFGGVLLVGFPVGAPVESRGCEGRGRYESARMPVLCRGLLPRRFVLESAGRA